jgi:hypothetical protein
MKKTENSYVHNVAQNTLRLIFLITLFRVDKLYLLMFDIWINLTQSICYRVLLSDPMQLYILCGTGYSTGFFGLGIINFCFIHEQLSGICIIQMRGVNYFF